MVTTASTGRSSCLLVSHQLAIGFRKDVSLQATLVRNIVYCFGSPFPSTDRMEEFLDASRLFFLRRLIDRNLPCLRPR